jgi:hypothetical protein
MEIPGRLCGWNSAAARFFCCKADRKEKREEGYRMEMGSRAVMPLPKEAAG